MSYKPNPLGDLVRWGWVAFLVYAVFVGAAVLVTLLLAAWWVAPFVAVFAYATYVLLRNRRR